MFLTQANPCPPLRGRINRVTEFWSLCLAAIKAGRSGALGCIGLFMACALLPSGVDRAPAAEAPRSRAAAALFTQYCVRCHGADGRGTPGRVTLPVIPDFTDPAWQQSRSDPQLVISVLEGKDQLMPANRGPVNDKQAADLVAYIRSTFGHVTGSPVKAETDFDVQFTQLRRHWAELERQLEDLRPGAVAIPDRPFTSDDIERGRELFAGYMPLANGGAACIACHAAHGSGGPEGGRLGPDLTKVYERVGSRSSLITRLSAPATPTMQPLYQQHPLKGEEVLSLVAYLEDADKRGIEQEAGFPLKFFLFGLGGTVVGLTVLSTLWQTRSRPGSRPLAEGALAAAIQPETELSPVPQEWGRVRSMAPANRSSLPRLPEENDIGAGL